MKSITIVQEPPVFLDKAKTIQKVCDIIEHSKSDIIMFPEAYIPGYPAWVWNLRAGTDLEQFQQLHKRYVQNSVNLSDLKSIQDSASNVKKIVAIGFSELSRTGTTLYNSYALIGPQGTILNIHRKLIPTNPERMIWGRGDASGLNVIDTPAGRIGSLICWENYMPLSRFALYDQGIDLYLAPTWDYGPDWHATLKHIARESGCWVASSSTAIQGKDTGLDIFEKEEWLSGGDAVLIKPFGDVIAGPLSKKKENLTADYDLQEIIIGRRSLDVAGHYSRPDIFTLKIDKRVMNNTESI